MTWGNWKTGEWPGEMPCSLEMVSWASLPQFPYVPMECRTNLTPGIWVHWSLVYGPLLQGLLQQFGEMTHLRWPVRGDVMVMSSAAGMPLSHPGMKMSAGLVY